MDRKILVAVYRMLMTDEFEKWHIHDFEDHIEYTQDCKPREEIMKELEKMIVKRIDKE